MFDFSKRNISELATLEVSLFDHKGVKKTVCINLFDALRSFKIGIYKQSILKLRQILDTGNREDYSILKSKLPAITFCGKFVGGHKKENLSTYNHLLIIDIDNLDTFELNRIKECLHNDDYIFAFWESPSMRGVKGLISISYNAPFTFDGPHSYHKYAFSVISEYFTNTYNITLDSSGSDISRLCFVSYDPNLIIKNQYLSFYVDTTRINSMTPVTKSLNQKIKQKKISNNLQFDKRHLNSLGKNSPQTRTEMAKILRYLTRRKLSITSTYDNWYRVGYAIANTFSCDLGERYYMKLCRLDGPHHDEEESKKMLIYCYNNSKGVIKFATIIHLAQQLGYKRDGGKGG